MNACDERTPVNVQNDLLLCGMWTLAERNISCFFLLHLWKKRKSNLRKGILSNIIDNPTDLVAAIERFANNNKEEAESAIDGFCWWKKQWLRNIFFIKFSFVHDISWKLCLKWMVYLWMYCSHLISCLFWTDFSVEYQYPWYEIP